MDKFSILNIIDRHFKTFRTLDQVKGGMPPIDKLYLFLLPISIALILTWNYEEELIFDKSDIIKTVAIFGAFFFNLIALMFNVRKKIHAEEYEPLVKKYAKDITVNISFNIFLSIILLIITLPAKAIIGYNYYLSISYSFLIYFLVVFYLINLLVVLKKIYIILDISIES